MGSRRAERSSQPRGNLNATSRCRGSNCCEPVSRAIHGHNTYDFQTRCSFCLLVCFDAGHSSAVLIYCLISSGLTWSRLLNKWMKWIKWPRPTVVMSSIKVKVILRKCQEERKGFAGCSEIIHSFKERAQTTRSFLVLTPRALGTGAGWHSLSVWPSFLSKSAIMVSKFPTDSHLWDLGMGYQNSPNPNYFSKHCIYMISIMMDPSKQVQRFSVKKKKAYTHGFLLL